MRSRTVGEALEMLKRMPEDASVTAANIFGIPTDISPDDVVGITEPSSGPTIRFNRATKKMDITVSGQELTDLSIKDAYLLGESIQGTLSAIEKLEGEAK